MRKLPLLCATLAVAAGIAGSAARAETMKELNFGIISTEASVNQKKNWQPFLADMAKAIGIKINGFYATDYAGVIEAMRFNKVQLAWFGNKSGMEASNRSNAEVFAQVVSRDGRTGYYSHIIVNKDSPYKKLSDILKCDKTLNFGIGDPNSTSGFLVPTAYIFAANDIDPKKCFKTVRNASHQANAMAVAHKQVDAATNNSEDLQRTATTAPEARKDDPHHLDLADHPARPADVAQGSRAGGQNQNLHLPDELRPRRQPRKRSNAERRSSRT